MSEPFTQFLPKLMFSVSDFYQTLDLLHLVFMDIFEPIIIIERTTITFWTPRSILQHNLPFQPITNYLYSIDIQFATGLITILFPIHLLDLEVGLDWVILFVSQKQEIFQWQMFHQLLSLDLDSFHSFDMI